MTKTTCTYLVPTRDTGPVFLAHLQFLNDLVGDLGRDTIDLRVYSGSPVETLLCNNFNNIKAEHVQSSSFYEKWAYWKKQYIAGQITAFSPADDVMYYAKDDIDLVQKSGAAYGIGRSLLCRPIPKKRFRIFRGWTHLFALANEHPNTARVVRYAREGPSIFWTCYNTKYFESLGGLVEELQALLRKEEQSLIEDCINIANLFCTSVQLPNSHSLRFLDGQEANSEFCPSIICLQKCHQRGVLPMVCIAIKSHLKRAYSLGFAKDIPDIASLSRFLKLHSIGYREGRSRKWRDWIDVELRPFERAANGIIPSTDLQNRYQNIYCWDGKTEISEPFPANSWLSESVLTSFVMSVPSDIWSAHSL